MYSSWKWRSEADRSKIPQAQIDLNKQMADDNLFRGVTLPDQSKMGTGHIVVRDIYNLILAVIDNQESRSEWIGATQVVVHVCIDHGAQNKIHRDECCYGTEHLEPSGNLAETPLKKFPSLGFFQSRRLFGSVCCNARGSRGLPPL
jgi:hypothetical protein